MLVITGLSFLLSNVALADRGPDSSRLPVTFASRASVESVVVARGDHLWKISARHLHANFSRDATSSEILPYWREVVETNRPTLRSGDPDVIHPGEVIRLPAVNGPP